MLNKKIVSPIYAPLKSFQHNLGLYFTQNSHLVPPHQIKDGVKITSDLHQTFYILLISNRIWNLDTEVEQSSTVFADEVITVEFNGFGLIKDALDYVEKYLTPRETATPAIKSDSEEFAITAAAA